MSYYLTLREGPSATTSIPLLVVSDERVVGAFLRELTRITRAPVRPARPRPARPRPLPVRPVSPSAPPQSISHEQPPEGTVHA